MMLGSPKKPAHVDFISIEQRVATATLNVFWALIMCLLSVAAILTIVALVGVFSNAN